LPVRFSVTESFGRAGIDHMGRCAVALGRTAGEIAFDIGAEGGAAAGRSTDKAGEARRRSWENPHDDYPFLAGAGVAGRFCGFQEFAEHAKQGG
jgi:hypothetical protein